MLGKVRCAVVGGNRWGVGQKRLYSQEQVKPTKKLLLMDANGVSVYLFLFFFFSFYFLAFSWFGTVLTHEL
jgi:hypothetical protein